MSTRQRLARFSILLWPSLYSWRAIFLMPLAFLALGGFLTLFVTLSREASRTLIARATERAQAVTTLKLSGADTWQWKRALSCDRGDLNCLKMQLSFRAPEGADHFSLKFPASPACKICHSAALQRENIFYAGFPEIAPPGQSLLPYWLILGGGAGVGCGILGYFFILKRRRRERGICIAALDFTENPTAELRALVKKIASSAAVAYYAEKDARRIRWTTTPEKFHAWLALNNAPLAANRDALKLVALHADLAKSPLLPIELLRLVFQFLSKSASGNFLLQEALLSEKDQKEINMRRLVFKNKSGASLKFVAWELV